MKEKRGEHLLRAYLWQYKYSFCMFAAYIVIFAVVFSLYELETEAVLYAGGLCAALTVTVLMVHYLFYRNRHFIRKEMVKNIRILDERLPVPGTLAEADYQQMILALKQICDEDLTQWQKERQEHMDYYTTWVHQIKTPIAVMRMVLQEEDTQEHRELLAELFRIEQYVEMALSYLRLGSESTDFVFQQYRLDDLIRQAIHKYASQFVRKRIRLLYEPTEAVVLTDEKWLLFMIEQILSNAVKYTREGTVRITVTKEKVLQIADTGIGIAPEDLPRIFEKGFTGYNGRADKKSTGLGLYLCQKAAQRLSHRIDAASEVGKGTVFSIDLHTEKLEMV
ncbi:MAG: sensor histidine kinase [Eubacterium sp.]|nr:sensor histidine kinase [Eubacterium sp.]